MAIWGPHSHIPEVMAKAPRYHAHLDIFITAFNTLTNDRLNTHGGVGCIPFSSMVEYCKWAGIKQQEHFISILQDMDYHYVMAVNKQQEKKVKDGRTNRSKNRSR